MIRQGFERTLFRGRSRILQAMFFACLAAILVRAFHLQIIQGPDQRASKARQYSSTAVLSSFRGAIKDRRGEPLALSLKRPSLFINPKVFKASPTQLQELARLSGVPVSSIKKSAQRDAHFAWIKRKLSAGQQTKIEALEIEGIHFVDEPYRYYPVGNKISHLIGYVNIDDVGQMGIELQLEAFLRGPKNRVSQARDALARTIFHHSSEAAPDRPGQTISLSIDRAVQEIVHRELAKGIEEAKAKGGFALVTDPHTGAILAMASAPTFDPNAPIRDMQATRNRVLMDAIEPGSVLKTLTIGAALEEGVVRPSTKFDCEGGSYQAGGVRFRDSHKPEKQLLTVSETLETSSNVCTYKIAEKIGPETLYNYIQRAGIGSRENALNFPGQAHGWVSPWQKWRPIRFANIAFGQGIMTSPLELAQFFGAIANGGILLKPFYLKSIEESDGNLVFSNSTQALHRLFSQETSQHLRSMLINVVENGAHKAKSSLYTTAGKTGTSQKVDPNTKRYSKSDYWAVFAGMAPANDPRLVVIVVVDEPRHNLHYGSLWAAPIFRNIVDQSLRYLNVQPDRDLSLRAAKDSRAPL